MARLLLLRHAKAGWAEPGMRDFDRPLDATGRSDAEAIGAVIATCHIAPEMVVCSSARRARETFEGVRPHLSATTPIVFTDELYSTDATGYVEVVRKYGHVATLLVIGHNPMMEDVAFALYDEGSEQAKNGLLGGFPTSGLAVIGFPEGLANAAHAKGYLEAFHTPTTACA